MTQTIMFGGLFVNVCVFVYIFLQSSSQIVKKQIAVCFIYIQVCNRLFQNTVLKAKSFSLQIYISKIVCR